MISKDKIREKFVEFIEEWAEDMYIAAESWSRGEQDNKANMARKKEFIKNQQAEIDAFLETLGV